MSDYLTFAMAHPAMVGSFFTLLVLLIILEMKRGGAALEAQQAVRMMNHDQAIVLDVRKTADFRSGHIAGARNLPYAQLKERLHTLDNLKDRPLIVACATGSTARSVAEQLKAQGFQAYRLGGGMMEWQAQSLPVNKKP